MEIISSYAFSAIVPFHCLDDENMKHLVVEVACARHILDKRESHSVFITDATFNGVNILPILESSLLNEDVNNTELIEILWKLNGQIEDIPPSDWSKMTNMDVSPIKLKLSTDLRTVEIRSDGVPPIGANYLIYKLSTKNGKPRYFHALSSIDIGSDINDAITIGIKDALNDGVAGKIFRDFMAFPFNNSIACNGSYERPDMLVLPTEDLQFLADDNDIWMGDIVENLNKYVSGVLPF